MADEKYIIINDLNDVFIDIINLKNQNIIKIRKKFEIPCKNIFSLENIFNCINCDALRNFIEIDQFDLSGKHLSNFKINIKRYFFDRIHRCHINSNKLYIIGVNIKKILIVFDLKTLNFLYELDLSNLLVTDLISIRGNKIFYMRSDETLNIFW